MDCNPITEKDLFDDKVGILDIKAKLNNNIMCNIEMQIIDRKDIEKRILFYWSKLYASTVKAGDNYSDLQKCITNVLYSLYSQGYGYSTRLDDYIVENGLEGYKKLSFKYKLQ